MFLSTMARSGNRSNSISGNLCSGSGGERKRSCRGYTRRSFWILDNISPLRQLTSEVASRGSYLYRPAIAFEFARVLHVIRLCNRRRLREKPPAGAIIDYSLKQFRLERDA